MARPRDLLDLARKLGSCVRIHDYYDPLLLHGEPPGAKIPTNPLRGTGMAIPRRPTFRPVPREGRCPSAARLIACIIPPIHAHCRSPQYRRTRVGSIDESQSHWTCHRCVAVSPKLSSETAGAGPSAPVTFFVPSHDGGAGHQVRYECLPMRYWKIAHRHDRMYAPVARHERGQA